MNRIACVCVCSRNWISAIMMTRKDFVTKLRSPQADEKLNGKKCDLFI